MDSGYSASLDTSTPEGIDRAIRHLDSLVRDAHRRLQHAVDEGRVANKKAIQCIEDLEEMKTLQNEIQVAFDENADYMDQIGSELGDLKGKMQGLDEVRDAVASLMTQGLGEAPDLGPIQEKIDRLVKMSEENNLALEDVSARQDALAKDSGSLRVSLEDIVREVRQYRHMIDDMGTRLEALANKGDSSETLAAVEEKLNRLDTELRSVIAEVGNKQDEALTARVEELSVAVRELSEEGVAGVENRLKDAQEELSAHVVAMEARLSEVVERLENDTRGSQDVVRNVEGRVSDLSNRLDAELARINETWSRVTSALEKGEGVLGRADEAAGRVESMESKVAGAQQALDALLASLKEQTRQNEINDERIQLAVRLVTEVEDRVRGIGSGAPLPSAASPAAARPLMADSTIDINIDEVPDTSDLGFGLEDILSVMINNMAYDMYLKVGAAPTVRLDGDLVPIGNQVLSERDCQRLVFSAMTKPQRRLLVERKEAEFAYSVLGSRFRVSAFMQKGTVSATFHMLRTEMPTMEELGLPPVLKKLASLQGGLILVTGPAGSGKSTTLASIVDYINTRRKLHIFTVEDPIEFIHKDKLSLITQREVGTDCHDYVSAVRQALRHGPDVVMVGELNSPETIEAAVAAAETGKLVLSTLYSPNTITAVDRLLDSVSSEHQAQFRKLLGSVLRGMVSQRLLPRVDEQGLVAAVEVMLVTPAMAHLIREGKVSELYPHLQQGVQEGMQSFSLALSRLYEAGLIAKEEAMANADYPEELRMMMEGGAAPAYTETASSDTLMNWL